MPTTIDSAGITFNDATSFTSAVLAANSVGATQIANGSVTASKLGTNEQKQICKAFVNFDGFTGAGTTINDSFNVSSITKQGTGQFTVNLTTPLNNIFSPTVSNPGSSAAGWTTLSYASTTSAIIVFVFNGSNGLVDSTDIQVIVFGS